MARADIRPVSGKAVGAAAADLDWVRNGQPSGFFRETFQRWRITNTIAPSTGVMRYQSVPLIAGETVTNISIQSSGAATTPTNWWFALYSESAGTATLMAQSADQTTTAWASNTVKTLALSAPQTITATGIYYVAFMMAAATPVTLQGAPLGSTGAASVVMTGQKIPAGGSGSALTGTAPASFTVATGADQNMLYAVLT